MIDFERAFKMALLEYAKTPQGQKLIQDIKDRNAQNKKKDEI